MACRIVTWLTPMFPYTARDVLDDGGLWCLGVVLNVGVKFSENLFEKGTAIVEFL